MRAHLAHNDTSLLVLIQFPNILRMFILFKKELPSKFLISDAHTRARTWAYTYILDLTLKVK